MYQIIDIIDEVSVSFNGDDNGDSGHRDGRIYCPLYFTAINMIQCMYYRMTVSY